MPREGMQVERGTAERYSLVAKAVKCWLVEVDFIPLSSLRCLKVAEQVTASQRLCCVTYHGSCESNLKNLGSHWKKYLVLAFLINKNCTLNIAKCYKC